MLCKREEKPLPRWEQKNKLANNLRGLDKREIGNKVLCQF